MNSNFYVININEVQDLHLCLFELNDVFDFPIMTNSFFIEIKVTINYNKYDSNIINKGIDLIEQQSIIQPGKKSLNLNKHNLILIDTLVMFINFYRAKLQNFNN